MKLKIIAIMTILLTLGSISVNAQWEQINEDGFGNPTNVAPRGVEIFNGSLVSGTANYIIGDGAIILDRPLRLGNFIYEFFSGDTYAFKNHKSNGCEIWAYNGTALKQIVGDEPEAKMNAGFGNKNTSEVGVLIQYNEYLYVGVRNSKEGCQVWRTRDINDSWEQVVTDGFGNINNTWCMEAEIFGEYLYMGTYNTNGCELYRTRDGLNWEAVIGGNSKTEAGLHNKDVYVWSMEVYDNTLYVGTQQGQIWRSRDGVAWEPVVAYDNILQAKLHGAYYPTGFRKIFYQTGGIRNMLVYNDELYIFTAGGYSMDFKLANLGKIFTYSTDSLISRLIGRAAFQGAEIWKYNSTDDEISRVVGKKGNEVTNRGFGDKQNLYFWSVQIYNNSLFVGTWHPESISVVIKRERLLNWTITFETPQGHAELWKYDGNAWEEIVGKGSSCEFDDEYNWGIRELKSYKDSLYLYTYNLKTGSELWEYSSPDD